MSARPFFARRAVSALAVIASATLAGCQYFFPTPIDQRVDTPADAPPPEAIHSVGAAFIPGEVMKADIYFDSLVVGKGELRAVKACDAKGTSAVRVVLHAESTGVGKLLKDASTDTASLIRLDDGLPISSWGDTTIGEDRTIVDALFYRSRFQFQQTEKEGDNQHKPVFGETVLPIEGTPHDAESVLGYVRNWHPPDGTVGFLYTVAGRYAWRSQLTFVGPETLTRDNGDEKTLRIEGLAQKLVGHTATIAPNTTSRRFTIWFSDDDRHAPLRILLETSVAKITIELTSYAREPVHDDPSLACEPLFDEKDLLNKLAARKKRQEDAAKKNATKPAEKPKPGAMPSPNPTAAPTAKPSDKPKAPPVKLTPPKAPPHVDADPDDKEDKDSLDRILNK